MSKKMTLLALAVAALFGLPGAASAQEIHLSGVTSFSGSSGASSLQTSGEPTISCTAKTVSGSFNTGSTTTGTYTIVDSGCTAAFFGIKANCNTSGASSGTLTEHGIFHAITLPSSKTAYMYTLEATTIICAGFSNTTVAGTVIGTITSPACGVSSKSLTLVFNASGSTQEHKSYTGVNYNLTAQTGAGSKVEAGLTTGTITLTSSTSGTLECT
jgi:hypothetical protein